MSITKSRDRTVHGKSHHLCRTAAPAAESPSLEFAGEGKMKFTQRTQETEAEKLERLQREREQMRQAIANYSGPVTKCPQGKTSDPYAVRPFRGTWRTRSRNGDGR